jgi:peroxiredoxin
MQHPFDRRTALGGVLRSLVLVFGSPWLVAGAQAAAVVGQAAPAFTLPDTAGKSVSLADYKGKHVVLEWHNPNCPYIKRHYEAGNMQSLQREFTGKGVVWLAVNSTNDAHPDFLAPAQVGRWLADKKSAVTRGLMDFDGKVGREYGARTTPHMYVIDPQGRLVYAGGIDDGPFARGDDIKKSNNFVRAALNESMAGKPVSKATAPPYGCSVKY